MAGKIYPYYLIVIDNTGTTAETAETIEEAYFKWEKSKTAIILKPVTWKISLKDITPPEDDKELLDPKLGGSDG